MGKIIGIDLGTTNSVVAIMEGKEPKVIPNEEGGRLTPSVVAFDDKGEVLVGQIARRQAITNPENNVYSIKRFKGRKVDEVQDEIKGGPYEDDGAGTFSSGGREGGEELVEGVPTKGKTHLGGDDIDDLVMHWLIAEFKKDQGIDVGKDKIVLQRLKEAAEKAKIELSSVQET